MKKLNKFVAGVVTMAMIGGTSVAAFAADGDVPTGTDSNSNLVKYLEKADGVTTPTVTFNFELSPYSDSAYNDLTHMPGTKTTSISNTEMKATAADDGTSLYGTKNIIALFTTAAPESKLMFDHAGEYVYLVKETGSTFDNTADELKQMTLDTQAYFIHIQVKNGDNGLEVGDITAETATATEQDVLDPETGEATGQKETVYTPSGNKVDPDTEDPTITNPEYDPEDEDNDDPQDGNGTDTGTNGTKLVGVVFDNNYQETIKETPQPDPEDPTDGNYGALGVTKTVSGEFADKTVKFPFEVTVKAPANYTGADEVDAYIYTGTTKAATAEKFKLDGTAKTIYLTDGQALSFEALPAGTTYTVKEKLSAVDKVANKYTPSYSWIDETAALPGSETAGSDLALTKTVDNKTVTGGLIADTDAKNAAYYTNTFDDDSVTPTGILINNLPYIALALVAIGGLVAYVVVRRRQNDEA